MLHILDLQSYIGRLFSMRAPDIHSRANPKGCCTGQDNLVGCVARLAAHTHSLLLCGNFKTTGMLQCCGK